MTIRCEFTLCTTLRLKPIDLYSSALTQSFNDLSLMMQAVSILLDGNIFYSSKFLTKQWHKFKMPWFIEKVNFSHLK